MPVNSQPSFDFIAKPDPVLSYIRMLSDRYICLISQPLRLLPMIQNIQDGR